MESIIMFIKYLDESNIGYLLMILLFLVQNHLLTKNRWKH
jgi:hypothetical protein